MLQELLHNWFQWSALVFITGFSLHLGMAVASMFLPVKTAKEITYDNLDKKD